MRNEDPQAAELRARLLDHPLYGRLRTIEDLRIFMAYHVFAVWDFMSLLKALQRHLTCVEVPWIPKGDVRLRALVNEIVACEESDPVAGGRSHFEWYLDAMDEAGADSSRIRRFLDDLGSGASLENALRHAPPGAGAFVRRTLSVAMEAPPAAISAEFTTGRERLIPDMFLRFVEALSGSEHGRLEILRAYLLRHIEIDGSSHGALAEEMTNVLARDDGERHLARRTACDALVARHLLWNSVVDAIDKTRAASRTASTLNLS